MLKTLNKSVTVVEIGFGNEENFKTREVFAGQANEGVI